jgi:DNA-binding NtrC family response regulator
MTDATLPDTPAESATQGALPFTMALVVAWCAEEPERVGEVAIPPPGDPGEEVVWGRGGGTPDARRLLFQRQRPGRITPTGEVMSPRVSRVQLRLHASADQAIGVTNEGRTAVRHNGQERASFWGVPGDVVEVGNQIMLLCVRRPALLAGPPLDDGFPFGGADPYGIVGESSALWELRRRIAFVGPRAGHVLVRGESGSGKELVARALHERSPCASRAMVSRNAATLPEGLVDAELFGNLKNYPNPGTPERPGLVGEADGSTLFLDEIAEISTPLQARLLRLLDGGEYHRLGEARARTSRLRLVGATNRPESALKHDLLARFVFRLEVPSLNDCVEDIPLLAAHLLRGIAARDGAIAERFFAAGRPHLAPALVRALLRRRYSANARELLALLWQALASSTGDRIEPPAGLSEPAAGPAPSGHDPEPEGAAPTASEARLGPSPAKIRACLDAHNGVIEDAWRPLGLPSRHALTRLIKKHGLEIRKRPK